MATSSYIPHELYNMLYHELQYENALAIRVSLETGFRISDVLELKPGDLSGRTLSIIADKTGKRDRKVITSDLAKRLRQIMGLNWIFEGRFGNTHRCRQTVWKDVKKAAERLSLQGNVCPHSARKTFAVDDFRANGIIHTQRALCHDDISTTMLYAFSDVLAKPAQRAEAIDYDKLAELISNKVLEKLSLDISAAKC